MKRVFTLGFLITLLSISSIILYHTKKLSINNKSSDLNLAVYIGEEETNQIPLKDSGYYFNREKSNCNEGAKMKWDSISWSPVIENVTETRTKCNLYFTTTYTEGILNGADPSLKQELVPVTIDGNGTVRKADLTKKWYSYEEKQWANAIITQNSYDVLNREGKVKGATKEEGYVTFDGVDDYIDLELANYDFGKEVTLSIKLKLTRLQNLQEILVNVEGAGFGIFVSGSALKMEIYDETNKKYEYMELGTIEINKEYTLSFSYDGKEMKGYINGELKNTKALSANIKTSSMPVLIGANPNANDSNDGFTKMNVYQAVIYNRALSEEEIKTNMSNEIKVTNNTGLLSYIDFTNRNYEANEIIPENNIESYFVWIPRYKYQIFNTGEYASRTTAENKVQTIQVVFENKDTPISNGSTVGSWLTHPAFTAFNSNGMWVGKFETGKKSGNDNVRNGEQVQIKPNVISWKNIQVGNAFYTTYDYKRGLDSHMMKNTEWGAVAYLQHSMYGSQQGIRINNNSSFITGYSGNQEPTCGYTGASEACNISCNNGSCNQPYNTAIGYLASTTGNISGIYDMAGGSWEYVMGVLLDTSGKPMSGQNAGNNSGFKGSYGEGGNNTTGYDWPDPKYYDTYSYSTSDQVFGRRILGDATGEMGPFESVNYGSQMRSISSWYSNGSWFILSSAPWFERGGIHHYGTETGIFAFSRTFGHSNVYGSFRVVLTP